MPEHIIKLQKRGGKWFGGIKNCLKMPSEGKIATRVNIVTHVNQYSISLQYIEK